jgi:hypothetical protein
MEDEERLMSKKERSKVIETEDASRGPLSGCIRLADSSRVIQRLKVNFPNIICTVYIIIMCRSNI